MKKILIPLSSVFLLSCENKIIDDTHITKDIPLQKTIIDSTALLSYYEQSKEKIEPKFVFVVLTITENTGTTYDEYGNANFFQPEQKYYITDIVEETSLITEETKIRIQDKVVNTYLSSINAKVNDGKVLSKEIFVFDDYISASQKRNEYLIK
ncbi:hypothetical protein JSO59_007240 [Riemerella anatipestifer]|uniref:hypothetical protein n=1 Tax=Riemerella anatipestifer TaxID=34085 RepID=UPI0030C2DC43